jgi:hypothetical protein
MTAYTTVPLPRADKWVRGDQIFCQTNGPIAIAKISENEGSLQLGVYSGCQFSWDAEVGRLGVLRCLLVKVTN